METQKIEIINHINEAAGRVTQMLQESPKAQSGNNNQIFESIVEVREATVDAISQLQDDESTSCD